MLDVTGMGGEARHGVVEVEILERALGGGGRGGDGGVAVVGV